MPSRSRTEAGADRPSRSAAERRRAVVFAVWLVLIVLFAAYVVTAMLLVAGNHRPPAILSAPVPFLMIFLLALGLGWLTMHVFTQSNRRRDE